jgi:hypothetical protein
VFRVVLVMMGLFGFGGCLKGYNLDLENMLLKLLCLLDSGFMICGGYIGNFSVA